MAEVVVPIETVMVACPFHRYRVLFSDGVVMDFVASRDDSELRRLALVQHWGDKGPESSRKKDDHRRIVGVTDLGEEFVFTPTGDEEVVDDGVEGDTGASDPD